MLTISGRANRFCSGLSRRDVLRVGSLGLAGFTLTDLFRQRAEAATLPARAKNVIMIYLPGGPSHIDTFDPKPDAPAEIRGEFGAVKTKLDGVQFCDLLPKTAAIADRLAVLRAIPDTQHEHSSSHLFTGYGNQERAVLGDRPSIGSVLWKLHGDPAARIPAYVTLNRNSPDSGTGAGYLEPAYEPLFASGPGKDDLNSKLTQVRLDSRRRLLHQIDGLRGTAWETQAATAKDAFTQRALDVLSSTATRDAFDISKENPELRKKYAGADNMLTARRLVEAGVHFVALDFGGWDTHGDNFKHLKGQLPQMDQAYTTLLQDLEDHGLLKETLVVMWGEFGRTPRVNAQAGRDHWPSVMSAVLAGGGLRTGQVIGSTTPDGAYADNRPTPLRSVVATLYTALGIDPKLTFMDRQGRPTPLIGDHEAIAELL